MPVLPLLLLLSQAEPAPPPAGSSPAPVPDPGPAAEEPAPPPGGAVGFAAGIARRLPPAGDDVPPALGFSLTTLIGHRYALLGGWVGLGVTASFGYDRYSRTVRVTRELGPGQDVPYDAVRGVSMFDFCALQTAVLELGRVRPWAAVGGGVSVGHFTSPEPAYAPGESRSFTAVLQGGLGADVTIQGTTDVGLRLEYSHLLPSPRFRTEPGARLAVFGNRVSARLAVQYRF